jgi:hypothetical protein
MKQIIRTFIALSVILIFSAACVTAQDKKKSLLSIHLGVALPTGDFASTSQYSEKSGYAETGFSGALKFTQMLSDKFGIGIAVHSDINSLNASELQLQFQRVTGFNGSVSADSWNSVSFLVGGEFQEALSSTSKSVFDLSLMLGYMSATFPATNITFSLGNSTGFFSYPSRDAGTFAFLIGAGFYLSVSEKISIPITIDYLAGTPHFDSSTASTSGGPATLDAYDQPMSNFNLMTGIVIQLN